MRNRVLLPFVHLGSGLDVPKKKITVPTDTSQITLFPLADLPEPFRKAVPAVHVAPQSGAISLQQGKMFNALIKNAIEQNKQGERVWFEYQILDLIEDVGLNTKNRDYVKATVNSLVGFVVNWDHLSGKSEWNASGLIAGAKMSGSTLKYQFSDNMRELLMNPQTYARIDMRIARSFKRGHALTLWENVVRYEGVGRTPKLSVESIRDLLLGLDWREGSYSQYKIFKSRVLQPALIEINEVSDHEIEMAEFKNGRAIAAVQFSIKPKRKPEITQEADLDLVGGMTKLGIPLAEARKLASTHSNDAIRKAIDYTEQRVQKTGVEPVAQVGAYFRKAVEGGWEVANSTPAEKPPKAPIESGDELKIKLHAQYAAHRTEQIRGFFNELDATEQEKYVSQYNEQQPSEVLRLSGSKKVKKSAESAFFGWLATAVWGEPTDADLLSFVLQVGKPIA